MTRIEKYKDLREELKKVKNKDKYDFKHLNFHIDSKTHFAEWLEVYKNENCIFKGDFFDFIEWLESEAKDD